MKNISICSVSKSTGNKRKSSTRVSFKWECVCRCARTCWHSYFCSETLPKHQLGWRASEILFSFSVLVKGWRVMRYYEFVMITHLCVGSKWRWLDYWLWTEHFGVIQNDELSSERVSVKFIPLSIPHDFFFQRQRQLD